jgi:hypothetical protein
MKTEGVETGINRSRLQLTDWLLVEAALLFISLTREKACMGLLEYQPMPPLRDVTHGCVHLQPAI